MRKRYTWSIPNLLCRCPQCITALHFLYPHSTVSLSNRQIRIMYVITKENGQCWRFLHPNASTWNKRKHKSVCMRSVVEQRSDQDMLQHACILQDVWSFQALESKLYNIADTIHGPLFRGTTYGWMFENLLASVAN